MISKHWREHVFGIAIVAILATACSSSTSKGSPGASSPTPTTGATNAAVLGTPKAASGQPIKVGFIGAGKASAIDNSNELVIASATAKYVNDYLGGIAGRPLQLITCADLATPSGATDCANKLLSDHVVAVLSSQQANPAAVMAVLKPANVPYVPWIGADPSVLTSAAAFTITNPLTGFAGPIKIAHEDGVKKVAIVSVDVPAAKALPTFAKPLFAKAGIDLTTTFVPLGTPDLTPQIQAALSSGAKEFYTAGDISLCTNTLKALKTLGFTGKVVSNQDCLLDPSASSIGGFNGLIFDNVYSINPKEHDFELASAIAAKYAPGTSVTAANTGNVLGGFAGVIEFARAMASLKPANVSSAGVSAALKSMSPQPMPLLQGQTFQCNGKASTLLTSVCSSGVSLATLDSQGNVTKSENFDAYKYIGKQ
jgi:ABC-type branched-subunit amino acid transport system substrate-binding protein